MEELKQGTVVRCVGCGAQYRVRPRGEPWFASCPKCAAAVAVPGTLEGCVDELPVSYDPDPRDPVVEGILARGRSSNSGWVLTRATLVSAVLLFALAYPLLGSRHRDSEGRVTVVAQANVRARPSSRDDRLASRSSLDAKLPAAGSARDKSTPPSETPTDASVAATEPAVDDKPVTCSEPEETPVGDDAQLAKRAVDPEAALAMPVGRNFKIMPIHDVVNYLTETTGVAVELDMKSLWFDQGTTKNVPVTIDAENLTVREFLEQVVTKQLKAVYQVRGDKIVIVSRKSAGKTATTTP